MCAFILAMFAGRLIGRLVVARSDAGGTFRRLRQYRLYGARPGAGRARPKAAAPTALIFCCDSIFLFSIVPLLIALTDGEARPWCI